MSVFIVLFLRYSGPKNGVTLKYGFDVVQGPWKWRCSIDHIRLSAIVISIALLYYFRVIWRWIISRPWNLS